MYRWYSAGTVDISLVLTHLTLFFFYRCLVHRQEVDMSYEADMTSTVLSFIFIQ